MSLRQPSPWAGLLAFLIVSTGAMADDRAIDFNRDIRPILSENCFACHGPDKNKRLGELRLDTKDGLLSPRKNDLAAAVIPRKPDESELFQRITSDDDELKMPPPGKGKALTAAQVGTVKAWIEQGAEWKGHWAYIKPSRPRVPLVADAREARNPIDAFILARLTGTDLKPSPEADRATLIRRVSLDLTGLPPTPDEVRVFLDDDKPEAFERVVDRLLASPHYGERMASRWLDLVRFADTIGYHSDNPRNIWPYRDYVIESFNKNTPFDRFTIEQIAGDLLPDAGPREKVASGYNRLLQTTEEGGAQAKEYAAKYAADRVRNASTVWLGATMGCSECHDHKYDPFLTKDFYRFAAFFADIDEPIVGKREPGMPVPDAAAQAELSRREVPIREAKARLAADSPERSTVQKAWEDARREPIAWTVLDSESAGAEGESSLRKEPGGVLKSFGKVGANESLVVTFKTETAGITAFKVEALADPDLPAGGPGTAADGSFFLTEFKVSTTLDAPEAKPVTVPLLAAVSDFAVDGREAERAIDGRDDTGWSAGRSATIPRTAVFETIAPIGDPGSGARRITIRLEFRSRFPQQNFGKFRISATTAPDAATAWVPDPVRAAVATPVESRSPEQKAMIASYFRATSAALRTDRQGLAIAVQNRDGFLDSLPTSLVSISGMPRPTRVLPRGNWLSDAGELVSPGVPEFLTPLANDKPSRLDLARWIVSRDNPLPARVFVNRVWAMMFGQGLSKALDDLGIQGEWPTHPELLDWLAVEFMDSGWDVRHLVRLMVTSATYRQASRPSAVATEHDPYNRLLSHQSRFRMDAEIVRDNALAVSGLLARKVGGPSVKPYQPAGYWESLNFPTREWVADKGESEYRRAMYTFWQRTFPQPSLLAFDAPSREECVAERPKSNIPQQALALLNDPSYVEASRAFAERIIREGGADAQGRIAWAFENALSRRPTADEVRLLVELLDKQLIAYRADEKSANVFLRVGERPVPTDLRPADLAAWTSVARAVLNLHETITRP
jgi:Protein of unknown function (DUF1553)/Protein of unknown function (DUF1549)/Planctomycete cytochrome C